MRYLPTLSVLAALIVTPLTVTAEPFTLKSYQANYKVSASGLDLGKLSVQLKLDGDNYVYTKATDASGLMKWISNDKLKESSEGVLGEQWPQPQKYHYLHTRKKGTKEESVNFTKDSISGHYNKKEFSFEPQMNLQDRASQDIVLMKRVSEGQTSIEMKVVEKRKIRDQSYSVIGKETLSISGKEYETIKLVVNRKNSKRVTQFWLAPKLNYIPVQFTHKDGEDKPTVQSRLVSLTLGK